MSAADDPGRSPGFVPGRAIVRAIAWLVPAAEREDWRAEWEAELCWRWSQRERRGDVVPLLRVALALRSLGALPDALWMRHRYGDRPMLSQDIRLALRSMRTRPGFSTIVALTLALGLGANAALFSVVHAVLLRQLPFADPARLVIVSGAPTDGDSAKVGRSTSFPDYLDLRDAARSFASLAAMQYVQPTLTQSGLEPMQTRGAAVTANFFSTLGVAPALGRGIAAEEDRKGGAPVAVLSHALWQLRFGGDPRVVGERLVLDGTPATIVGVMPAGFEYPQGALLWVSAGALPRTEFRGVHGFTVIGRLAASVSMERAESEARTIARRLEQQYPADNAKRTARLEPMRDVMVRRSRPTLLLLSGAVALVLLVACTNLAGLFLARAASRAREAAVRTALGAKRGQLLRQLLTESVLLSCIGGAAGLAVAALGVRALVAIAPEGLLGGATRAGDVGIDAMVLAFLAAVSLTVGLAFGLMPAWHFARADGLSALRAGTRGGSPGVGQARVRRALVVAEVALAMALAVGAGLLAKSFIQLRRVDPGFVPEGLSAVQLQLPPTRYRSNDDVRAFNERLLERVRALPGVRGAVLAFSHPLDEGFTSSFAIEGREPPKQGEEPEARVRPVGAGYFRLAGVRLLSGREIEPRDRLGAPAVVVINDAFSRMHFPGENPIGKRILRAAWWKEMPTSYEIVGVVANERYRGPDTNTDPATYFSIEQFTMPVNWLLVRSDLPTETLAPSLRRTIWSLDRDLPLDQVQDMARVLADETAAPRFNTSLLLVFALVALLLAALGVYGVLSYTVARRTTEIGLRMALGAPRSRVVALVVREGVLLAGLGVVAGLAIAASGSRLLEHLLFEVRPSDPWVLGGTAALLAVVACAAAYLPARRAARVDPMVALRAE
jgi:predicted permease